MDNYSLQEFLGIFLIGFPSFLFLIGLVPKVVEILTPYESDVDLEKQNFYHHHYHYKAR